MSVQAGIWNFDGKPVDSGLIAEFSASLKEQGPDGESCWVDNSIALLYRPFHTTAASRGEKQPYRSRKGFVFTWDGRLDNREELIAEFRSYLEAQPTDVAIVAAAFDHWGTSCFRSIVGDFAVSIWKPIEHELVFAADYMAIRHIFYYLKHDWIWWSTDLAPLVLLSGNKFQIDDDYIAGYFAHDPDGHLTPYREIREVPAGHFICVRDGRSWIDRHWNFSPKSRIRYKTDMEYEEHFRHVFRQSVRRRLRSDSPILAELSGGLDSSSIVCMADEILGKKEAQIPRVDTLSYYDTTEPHGDDWIYFHKIEVKRARSGHHLDTSKVGTAPGPLGSANFNTLPGELGVWHNIDTELGAIVQAGHYRIILSGLGGDEFLGGIPNPSGQLADLIVKCDFLNLAKQLTAWSLVKRRPWVHLLFGAMLELLPIPIAQRFVGHAKVEPWIVRRFARRHHIAARLLDVSEHFGMWLPTRRSSIGTLVGMSNKMAKETTSGNTCLDCRYPYLDRDFLEFILSIPASQLLRPGERRSLMRRSLSGLVPYEVLSRRTKQLGSRTPIIALGKCLNELDRLFSTPISAQLGFVDGNVLLQKVRAATNGEAIHLVHLFRTISLELWLQALASRQLINLPPSAPFLATAAAEMVA